jgi:tetrahydromethanopterin S-methyltransferase subunit B
VTPESYLAVIGGVIAAGGALTAIVRVIVEHTTDEKFDLINEKIARLENVTNDRIARLERRHSLLQQFVKGEADTFTRDRNES